MRPLRVRSAVLLGALSVLAVGCSSYADESGSVPPDPSDDWVAGDCVTDGTFASIGYDAAWTCGYVMVPEHHEDPGDRYLSLPVAIHAASGPLREPDPLFVAQGGPGGDAMSVFASIASSSAVSAERDVVVFNQRGTLGSDPELTCPELWDEEDAMARMSDEEASDREIELITDCRDRLESDGADLAAFNSVENARDVDAIREALGYDELNFYGVSYGSRLGLNLLRERPEHVRAVILDAVVPTHVNFLAEVAPNTDRLFHELAAACDADPACARAYANGRHSGTDLDRRIYALADRLDRDPVPIAFNSPSGRVEDTIDGAGLVDGLFQAAYLSGAVSVVPHMVDRMEHGDFRILEALQGFFASDRTDADGMYLSVVCSEDGDYRVSDLRDDRLPDRLTDIAREDARDMREACSAWSVPKLEGAADPVESDVPVLLLSGRFDPITPPSNGENAASYLSHAVQVVDPFGSHGVAFDGDCVDLIVAGFLDHPERKPDTACLRARHPTFIAPDAIFVPWLASAFQPSVPFFVRILLSAAALAAICLAIALWGMAFVVRKRRHAAILESDRELWSRWASRLLAILFVALGAVFGLAMGLFAVQSTLSPLSMAFSLSGAARPLFVLPLGMGLTALVMAAACLGSWLRSAWPVWERLVYTGVAAAAVAVTLLLAIDGNLTVLF